MAYKVRRFGHDPLGAYRRGGQRERFCKKGSHDISTPDKRVFVGKPYEQCKQCYRLRLQHKRTHRPGYCRRNAHPMVGDNVRFRSDRETHYCLACDREGRRNRNALGYRSVRCEAYGCDRYLVRGPMMSGLYRCPKHRAVQVAL